MFLDSVPFAGPEQRRFIAPSIATPSEPKVPSQSILSTQAGFGAIMHELGRESLEFTRRSVTASPDVTVSTNFGPSVNGRGVYGREAVADTFKLEGIPSTYR